MAKCSFLRLTRISKRRLVSVALPLSVIFLFFAPDVIHVIDRLFFRLFHGPRMVDLETFKYTASQLQLSETEEQYTYSLLNEFHHLMTKFGIEYVGYGGTILGAARHASLVPWDDDADMVIMKPDKSSLLRAIATQDVLKLCYMKTDFYKVAFHNKSMSKDSNTYCSWPNLDVFLAHDMGPQVKVIFDGEHIYQKTSLFPPVVVPFGPVHVNLPRCFHQLASKEFGFKVCCTGFWNHRLETWAPKAACVECKQLQDHVAFANYTKLTDSSAKMTLRVNQRVIREEIVTMPWCD